MGMGRHHGALFFVLPVSIFLAFYDDFECQEASYGRQEREIRKYIDFLLYFLCDCGRLKFSTVWHPLKDVARIYIVKLTLLCYNGLNMLGLFPVGTLSCWNSFRLGISPVGTLSCWDSFLFFSSDCWDSFCFD